MKNDRSEVIKKDYEKLETYVKKFFTEKDDRRNKVLKLLEHFQDRIISSPASSRREYHSCYPGGWLRHTNNVIKISIDLFKLWSKNKGMNNVTPEEVVFSAMFHDLGKLGNVKHAYYIPNNSEWHRNKGMLYKINEQIKQFSLIPQRSLFLLQHFKIIMSQNEYYSILLSDGMFDDTNKLYFRKLNSNLPVLIHHADHQATLIEK